MRQEIIDKLERCTTLPTLPAVAVQVLQLCQDQELDLSRIAAAISRDPALAAKLVKTANSPLFPIRTEVTSISHALSLLGVDAVQTLVLTFSLSKGNRSSKQPGLQDNWKRSVLSALAARELCREAGSKLTEEAFICALLQDIGTLALSTALGAQYASILKTASSDHDRLIELEREALGADHAEIGSWLLGRWRLPKMITEIVGASHHPEQLDATNSPDLQTLSRVVALSGRFADLWVKDLRAAPVQLSGDMARYWRQEFDLETFTARMVETTLEVAPLFEVKLDSSERTRVLEQAQEILVCLSLHKSREVTAIQQSLARLESRTAILLVESQRDPLTGVANRGRTNQYLEDTFRAAVLSYDLVAVMFVDVDHFKNVNDTYGHSVGDRVLQSIAQSITRALRSGDFVGRYGGDEFIIVARIETRTDLAVLAERLRRGVSGLEHLTTSGASEKIPITISLGCTIIDPNQHLESKDVVEDADRALYSAKRAGRNRSEISVARAYPSKELGSMNCQTP